VVLWKDERRADLVRYRAQHGLFEDARVWKLAGLPVPVDTVRTTQDVLALLRAAWPQLAREFGVTRLALFGSYARGDQREDSDVGVLVEVDPSIGLRFVELADRIEALLGVRSDVVSRRAIGARHWIRIERDLVDVR
jgi:predicted nucleotidyltransferase